MNVLLAAVVFGSLSAFVFHTISRRNQNVPPGPGLRDLLQLTKGNWLELFLQWKSQYGPLTYISLAGTSVLVLHTQKAAADLLDRRSSIYSSRPRLIVAMEILCRNLFPGFMPYNELFIRMRKEIHKAIHTNESAQIHRPSELKEASLCSLGLLRCTSGPDSWGGELERSMMSVIFRILYNHPTLSSVTDAPVIAEVKELVEAIAYAAFPGTHLVELFPWMTYIPSALAPWKKKAEDHSLRATKVFLELFQSADDADSETPSFAGMLARRKSEHKLTDTQCAWVVATALVAGVDAIHGTMTWMLLALVHNPDVQKKCQEELDRVVGRSRVPTFDDLESLPYIRATVKECMRWAPVTPFGIPHCSAEDDWYDGYFIPKGTICIVNAVGMNTDKEIYGDDAHTFNPSRFLNEHGELLTTMPADTKDGHASFGFGRRICLGRYVANDTLFIYLATILWAFNVQADSPPSPTDYDYGGVVLRPQRFQCTFKPRGADVETILEEAALA